MDRFDEFADCDKTLRANLWNFYAELNGLLERVLDDFYEGGYYSQAAHWAINNLRRCIDEAEQALELSAHWPDYRHYRFNDRFLVDPGDQGFVFVGEGGDVRSAGLPTDFSMPFFGLNADRSVWNARWKPQLQSRWGRVTDWAQSHLAALPAILDQGGYVAFDELVKQYRYIHTMLRDLEQYGKSAEEFSRFMETRVLIDRIRYHPGSGELLYGTEHVCKLGKDTQEWLVWKMLHESVEFPRRVSYDRLGAYMTSQGRRVFTQIDESVTTQVARWNKRFEKYDIKPLHTEGKTIVLFIERKPKNTGSQ